MYTVLYLLTYNELGRCRLGGEYLWGFSPEPGRRGRAPLTSQCSPPRPVNEQDVSMYLSK